MKPPVAGRVAQVAMLSSKNGRFRSAKRPMWESQTACMATIGSVSANALWLSRLSTAAQNGAINLKTLIREVPHRLAMMPVASTMF